MSKTWQVDLKIFKILVNCIIIIEVTDSYRLLWGKNAFVMILKRFETIVITNPQSSFRGCTRTIVNNFVRSYIRRLSRLLPPCLKFIQFKY